MQDIPGDIYVIWGAAAVLMLSISLHKQGGCGGSRLRKATSFLITFIRIFFNTEKNKGKSKNAFHPTQMVQEHMCMAQRCKHRSHLPLGHGSSLLRGL